MNKHFRRIRWAGAILALWLLISGCRFLQTTEIGETRTETQAVELGSASAATVRVEMRVGELTVRGGADGLAQATFRTNVVNWEPRVDYDVNGDEGVLLVDQLHDDINVPLDSELVNQWDLLLSNTVPIKLEVRTHAGVADLDLRGLNLVDLAIETDAGTRTTTVDLSSALDHDLRATINGGVGGITLKLPADMGVQVSPSTGIGRVRNSGLRRDGDDYVNEAFGEAAHTLYVDITQGVGVIELIGQ